MRVIAGTARRTNLQTLDGLETRPTTDRIKETLFNMIMSEIPNCYFLDLFSGSGAIGIEALSRGATEVTFVENNQKAVSCIRANLDKTRLGEGAIILQTDALHAVQRLNGGKKFDYIYMDPPYHQSLEKQVLEMLVDFDILKEDGTIIIEAGKETDFSYLEELGYFLDKTKMYKTNMHVFIRKIRKETVC